MSRDELDRVLYFGPSDTMPIPNGNRTQQCRYDMGDGQGYYRSGNAVVTRRDNVYRSNHADVPGKPSNLAIFTACLLGLAAVVAFSWVYVYVVW